MNCDCIKGLYNFEFYALDCKHLIYQDMSDWMQEEHYVFPDTYEVKISLPGFPNAVTLDLKTQCLNKLTSLELFGQDGMYLPEGIYCFEVTSCGRKYTRSAANICRLECKWDHMVIQMKDQEDLAKVNMIRFHLDQVLFNAKDNKVNKAMDFFKIAQRELECIKCNC